jgi:hypothetical protein
MHHLVINRLLGLSSCLEWHHLRYRKRLNLAVFLLVCNQRVLLIKAVTAPERQTMKVLSTNPDGLQIGNSPNHQQIQNPRTMGQTQMVAPNPRNQNLQW